MLVNLNNSIKSYTDIRKYLVPDGLIFLKKEKESDKSIPVTSINKSEIFNNKSTVINGMSFKAYSITHYISIDNSYSENIVNFIDTTRENSLFYGNAKCFTIFDDKCFFSSIIISSKYLSKLDGYLRLLKGDDGYCKLTFSLFLDPEGGIENMLRKEEQDRILAEEKARLIEANKKVTNRFEYFDLEI